MNKTLRNEARELLQQGRQAQPLLITEAHLLPLPEVVQRYLRYSQVVGKEPIRTVRLKQLGKFRQSAQHPLDEVRCRRVLFRESIKICLGGDPAQSGIPFRPSPG